MSYKSPLELLNEPTPTKICAPMVRYSKLAFRNLVREYSCDFAFTPMIISNSFVQSIKARDSDFTTNKDDRPLIVQFAASNAKDFADATEIVEPFCDGVDLNCGCPQRWAMKEGYGAYLIYKPEQLCDMIRQTRNRISDQSFSVSVKLRIHSCLRESVQLAQQIEKCGATWLTVHGRTKEQLAFPVNYEAIALIKENVTIPVIANGDIFSLKDVHEVHKKTGCNGVMSARGLLSNPAMYAGYASTPIECVQKWVEISMTMGVSFSIFHHHLIDMLEHVLPRPERRIFNCLGSTGGVLDFLSERYQIECSPVT